MRYVEPAQHNALAAQSAFSTSQVRLLCYSEIMACNQCHNFICYACVNLLVEKSDRESAQMRCCFCLSESCHFEDWRDTEQKLYFDMTSKEAFKNLPLAPENSEI